MIGQTRFLKSQKVLRLATLGAGGRLHITPVWYLFREGRFYVGTNTGTKKARNIRRKKQVAFCVDVGVNSPDITGVTGQGRARLILERLEVARIARAILKRYYKSLQDESAKKLLADTDCIIEITPDGYASWSY